MKRIVVLSFMLAVSGAGTAGAREPAAAPPSHPALAPIEVRSLTRMEDPVILKAAKFPGMLGRPIAGLRAYALREGTLQPIPYQVDEFDRKGRIVCPEGEQGREDEDKGLLDDNDEIVVMASDLGDRAPRDLFPPEARAASEIVARDPGTEGRAWFYVFDFDAPPPRSPVVHVRYDPKADQAESDAYLVDFNERRSILLDDMRISGPDGKKGDNIIDRIKVRTWFKSRLFITFKFNEEDITSKVTAYKNGPVRAVRSAEYFLKLFFIKVTPSAFVDYLFYRNAIIGPSELKVPFNPKLVLRGGSRAVTGLDFNQAVRGWQFYTARTATPLTLTGKDDGNGDIEKEDVSWFALFGENRGTITRVVYGPTIIKAKQKYVLHFVDDNEREAKPEREKGETLLGFDLDLQKIPRGTHEMWFYQFFASPFKPGDEEKFNNILDRPLEQRALAVSVPGPRVRVPVPEDEGAARRESRQERTRASAGEG